MPLAATTAKHQLKFTAADFAADKLVSARVTATGRRLCRVTGPGTVNHSEPIEKHVADRPVPVVPGPRPVNDAERLRALIALTGKTLEAVDAKAKDLRP